MATVHCLQTKRHGTFRSEFAPMRHKVSGNALSQASLQTKLASASLISQFVFIEAGTAVSSTVVYISSTD